MVSERDIQLKIIRRLVRWRKWGGAHTENILGGIPRHLRGKKIVRNAIKDLVRKEWILPAIKTQETHYSLNPEKADEILQFYES
jgi:hypothetical protein